MAATAAEASTGPSKTCCVYPAPILKALSGEKITTGYLDGYLKEKRRGSFIPSRAEIAELARLAAIRQGGSAAA